MLFIIAMAIVIALFCHQVLKKISFKKRVMIYVFLIMCCILEFNFPMHFERIQQKKDFPKVYSWLATTPLDSTVIEMPIYNWNMFAYAGIEYKRMYYSTSNFRKTVNGGGGFTPPPWEKMAYELDATFPSQKSLERIKNMKVHYLIVHKNEFDQLYRDKFIVNGKRVDRGDVILNSLLRNPTVKKITQFQEDYVFAL